MAVIKPNSNVKGRCPKCNKTLDLSEFDENEIIFCKKDDCAYYSKVAEFIKFYNRQRAVDCFKKDIKKYAKSYDGTLNIKFYDPDNCAVIFWDKEKDTYVHYVNNCGGEPKITITEFKDTDRRLAHYIDLFSENESTKALPTFQLTFPVFINRILDFLALENSAGRYYHYIHPSFLILSKTSIEEVKKCLYEIDYRALPVVCVGDKYENGKKQVAALKRFLLWIDFKRDLQEVQIAKNFIKRIRRKKFTSMDKFIAYAKKDLEVIFAVTQENYKTREFEGNIKISGDNISLEGKYFCRQGIKERNEDYIGCGFYGFDNGNIMKVGENSVRVTPGFDLLSVFAVADGVSRSPRGDWASKFVVDYFLDNAEKFFKLVLNKDGTPKSDYFIEQAMVGQLCSEYDWQPESPSCNTALRARFGVWERDLAEDRIRLDLVDGKPPMTTLVLAYIIGGTLYYLNVGDTRLYHIPEQGKAVITKDITDARGRLIGPLGREECRYRCGKIQLNRNDRILIATDGVYSPVFKKKTDFQYFLKPVNEVMAEISKIVTDDSFDNMSAFLLKVGEGE